MPRRTPPARSPRTGPTPARPGTRRPAPLAPSPTASARPSCGASPSAPGRSRGTPRAGTRCRRTRRAGRASSRRPSSRPRTEAIRIAVSRCRASSFSSAPSFERAIRRGLRARVARALDAKRRAELGRPAHPPLRDLPLVAHGARVAILGRRLKWLPIAPHSRFQRATEFGSRTARRLRREGLVPGVVYGGGSEARAFSVASGRSGTRSPPAGPCSTSRSTARSPTPVVVKEQQRHPVRGQLIHLDLLEVQLDQAIQSEVAIELLGTEDAPGVKEGGVLEHITHEINVEALPTDIPESIAVDVSGMEIGDTLQLDSVIAPEGVEFALGEGVEAEEVTIATLNPPRVEEEPEPEVEEEAELVGEDGEPIEGPRARPRAEAARAKPARRRRSDSDSTSSRVDLPAGARGGGRARRHDPHRRPGNPGTRTPHPPQHRLRGRRRASRRWELPTAKKKFRGLITEGRTGPGGPRVAVLLPQTFMNESGELGRARARPAAGAARPRRRRPRRDRPALRRGPLEARRRGRRPQRAQVAEARASAAATSGASGWGRAPRLDRPRDRLGQVLGRFPEPDGGGPRPDRGSRRRGRAPRRANAGRPSDPDE